ncbi:hypothetical protein [Microbacterium aerolatum]|uniref:hypothetical protein n=1 Tax=Microbacterium aerolatum TaxID=153731 RepID=UPI00384FD8B2
MVVAAGVISGPAYADETPQPIPPEQYSESVAVEPLDATLLIDGKPTNIAVMPEFDPQAPALVFDGNGDAMPVSSIEVVYGDGTRADVSRVNTMDKAAVASCTRGWVAPGTGAWNYSVYGCSHIGFDGTARVGYGWTVDGNSLGSACLQGRGYQWYSYPGGGHYNALYVSIGCGGSGSSGGTSVPWGEVASTKRIKMLATSSPIGAAGTFA